MNTQSDEERALWAFVDAVRKHELMRELEETADHRIRIELRKLRRHLKIEVDTYKESILAVMRDS